MKHKEEKTVKKVLNVKRKLNSLENVKQKAKEEREASIEDRKKNEEGQLRKAEFNKLIKDHLKYNKKIVMTLMNHKVEEESKSFKEKLGVSPPHSANGSPHSGTARKHAGRKC